MNDAEEIILQFLLSLIRQSFSANYCMHEMNTQTPKKERSKRKHYPKLLASGFKNN